MRELVTVHFGQAGVQMGNATWELLCLEHGINENGMLRVEPREIESIETFFSISQKGKYVPRAAYIDLEPSVVDEVRIGSYRHLFHPNRLITGPEDAANNFARGFFTVGKLVLGVINHEIRKIMESCDNVHGLLIFRSLGGGTGAGLTSAIFDSLTDYPKTYKLEIPIYPSPTLSTSTVEPYNCLLAQHFCMEDIDVGLLFDNEAAFDVCSRNLHEASPSYNIINKLIAQVCSNLTVSIRFENTISTDLSVLQNNLVPYPRIHFPLCSYAPMIPESQNEHTSDTVDELTKAVFQSDAQLMKIDSSFGKIMSCALNYRGDVSPYNVYITLVDIKNKKTIEFVDWCPTGFKVGINLCPPVIVPDSCLVCTTRNVTLLSNTSAIGQAWQRLAHKFYMLYSKKSFVHWFVGEGMEECEFTEALFNISSLVKDYEECVVDTNTENAEVTPPGPQETQNTTKALPKTSPNASQKASGKQSPGTFDDATNQNDCIRFDVENDNKMNNDNCEDIERSDEHCVVETKYQTEVDAIDEDVLIEEEVNEEIEAERDEDVDIVEFVKEDTNVSGEENSREEENTVDGEDEEQQQRSEDVKEEDGQEEEQGGQSEDEEGNEENQVEIELEINIDENDENDEVTGENSNDDDEEY